MTNRTRDPKGYYVALGIEEDADADSIKLAYRTKAKRLHPDFNPSPIAAKQFHHLHEAYETLRDPKARKAYDQPWKGAKRNDPKKPGTERPPPRDTKATPAELAKNDKARGKPKAKSKPKPEPEQKPKPTTAPNQPAICKCGRVTAQPRYIIFDLVWGRINRIQRSNISGVFCRSCADRNAIRATFITWLAGWWAWPDGPKETVKALLSNIRGGQKPPERNARLLMQQSKAFRARGEMELARNAAEQALIFASTPTLRRDVENLLLTLSAHPSRTLKNRWAKPGWAATAQVLPLAVIVAVAAMIAAVKAPAPLTDMVKSAFNRTSSENQIAETTSIQSVTKDFVDRLLSVADDNSNLRTGPGANYQRVAVLTKGTIVLAAESDPSSAWIRVATMDGAIGFMNIEQLSSKIPADPDEVLRKFGEELSHADTVD